MQERGNMAQIEADEDQTRNQKIVTTKENPTKKSSKHATRSRAAQKSSIGGGKITGKITAR
jgi:hypothetical protein